MEKPLFVYNDYEAVWVPKNESNWINIIRVCVWILVVVIFIASLVFKKSILGEMTWSTRWLLVALAAGTCFLGGRKKVPSSFELQFYQDYLVLYRNSHYYGPKVTRREFDKFYYKDIKTIQFRTKTHRLNIYGVVEGIWYDYNKDGTIPAQPTYHKTTDSIAYFYTDFLKSPNIVGVFEEHCPIKVSIENN